MDLQVETCNVMVSPFLSCPMSGPEGTPSAKAAAEGNPVRVPSGVRTVAFSTVASAAPSAEAYQSVPIETVKAGMNMPVRNPITGKSRLATVTRTFKRTVHQIVKLVLADSKTGKIVQILRGTPEHPFFTPSGTVGMGALKPQMQVITRRGPPLVVKTVTWEAYPKGIAVYNLKVEGDHTYFVGKAQDGAWVHNTCPQANKAVGDAFRDEIADLMETAGYDVKTEVTKSTPLGDRRIDIEISKNGNVLGGIETKVGGSRYHSAQRKDWWLKTRANYPVHDSQTMSNSEFTKMIIKAIQTHLAPLGFKKKHTSFLLDKEDVLIIVNFQKSGKSTQDILIGTVNLGVVSKPIAERMDQIPANIPIWDAHWRQRLGHLIPEHTDKWWEVHDAEQAIQAGDEIISLLMIYGLPAIELVSSTSKLRELWQTGQSPGLTAGQRDQFLAVLTE